MKHKIDDLMSNPIVVPGSTKYWIPYIAKSIPQHGIPNLKQQLGSKLHLITKDLRILKIKEISDIISNNKRFIIPFKEYYNNIDPKKTSKRIKKIIHNGERGIPLAYKQIAMSYNPQITHLTSRASVEIITPSYKLPIITQLPPESRIVKEYTVYTDGSLNPQTKSQASATIITEDKTKREHIITTRIDGYTNSTRSELLAIANALTFCPKNSTINIYTDSQSALQIVNAIKDELHLVNPKLKYNNQVLVDLLKHQLIQFKGTLNIHKVKAHTGIKLNEKADQYAKQATKSNTIYTIYNFKPEQPYELSYLYHNEHRYEIDPKKVIKTLFQYQTKLDIETHFRKHFNIEINDIDYKNTMKLIDPVVSNRRIIRTEETSFRIKHFTYNLPTLARYNNTEICQRCNLEPETQNHFYTCIDNENYLPKMKRYLIHCLDQQIKTYNLKEETAAISRYSLLLTLKFMDPDILKKPEGPGFITKDSIERLQLHYHLSKETAIKIIYVVNDTWLRIIYITIWKVRNEITHKNQQMHTKNPKDPPKSRKRNEAKKKITDSYRLANEVILKRLNEDNTDTIMNHKRIRLDHMNERLRITNGRGVSRYPASIKAG